MSREIEKNIALLLKDMDTIASLGQSDKCIHYQKTNYPQAMHGMASNNQLHRVFPHKKIIKNFTFLSRIQFHLLDRRGV